MNKELEIHSTNLNLNLHQPCVEKKTPKAEQIEVHFELFPKFPIIEQASEP
jgi:hypothetical protein